YAQDCTTPKSDFNLGETVCAKATGVPDTFFVWHVLWGDPDGFIRQSDTAIADDQATYTYTLPNTRTSMVGGKTVDNRGTWSVNLTNSRGSRRAAASFAVHELAHPVADVFVQKFPRNGDVSVPSGNNIAFILV